MKSYIVDLEFFEKSEQREELDRELMNHGLTPTGKVTIYDNIYSTYTKYLMEYASTDIKIKTNLLESQTFLIGPYEIEIVND